MPRLSAVGISGLQGGDDLNALLTGTVTSSGLIRKLNAPQYGHSPAGVSAPGSSRIPGSRIGANASEAQTSLQSPHWHGHLSP